MALSKIPEITPQLLRELIDYDPDTGSMTWKPRPRSLFSSKRGHSIWNARFAEKQVGALETHPTGVQYRRFSIFKKMFRAHRAAWAIHHGEFPDGEIDHINGNGLDNRIKNLRVVFHAQNSWNCKRSKRNASGHTGVFWWNDRQAYLVSIGTKYVGVFPELHDAIQARREAEKAHGGYSATHGRRS